MDTRQDPKKEKRYCLPAVKIGEARNIIPIAKQIHSQAFWTIGIMGAAYVMAYLFANTGFAVPFLGVMAGFALARALDSLRTCGKKWGMFRRYRPLIADEQQGVVRQMSDSHADEVREILVLTVFGAVLAVGAVAWTVRIGGRWAIVSICILGQTVCLALVKVFGHTSPEFVKLGEAAAASGCRIALFRPFQDAYSTFAKRVFVPVLMGYGEVKFVTDRSYEAVSPGGVFGREYQGVDVDIGELFDDDKWKAGVQKIIQSVDIAIIDISTASPNLAWEVAQCYSSLPAHRVILLLNAAVFRERGVETYIRHFYGLLAEHKEMPRDVRPYVFTFDPGRGSAEVIAQDIHRKMLEIVQLETVDQSHVASEFDESDESKGDNQD